MARKCSGGPAPGPLPMLGPTCSAREVLKPAPAQLVKARGPVCRLRSWGLGVGPARAWGGLCRDVGWASVSFLCRGGLCPLEYCYGNLRRSSGSLLGLPVRWGAGRTEPSAPVVWGNQGQGWEGLSGCPSLCPPHPPATPPPILSEPCRAMADGFLGIGCSGKGRQEPAGQARC